MEQQNRRYVNDPREEMYSYGRDILLHHTYRQLLSYRQHRKSNTYRHSVNVCLRALLFAKENCIKVDVPSLVRAALLHDYYLYDWHIKPHPKKHATMHPMRAAENAERDFGLNPRERKAIESHMWPIAFKRIPQSREAWIICYADKCVAINEVFGWKQKIERQALREIRLQKKVSALSRLAGNPNFARGSIRYGLFKRIRYRINRRRSKAAI